MIYGLINFSFLLLFGELKDYMEVIFVGFRREIFIILSLFWGIVFVSFFFI